MTHRSIRKAALIVMASVSAVALAGCISTGPKNIERAPEEVPTPAATETAGAPGPDDLIVRTADTELHLESLTEEAGYEDMPDGTPAISGDELYVFVRQDGWMLYAEQRGGDPVGCGPESREPEVTDLGNGWWKISNRSAAGTYALWLIAGSGPSLPFGGTVGASRAYVEWTTKTDVDEPAASYLDITAYPDGSDGSVTLGLLGVETPLTAVKATVTLEGSDGEATVELFTPAWACDQPGDLTLHAPLTAAQVTALGDPDDLSYTVELYLDGVTYTSSGPTNTASAPEPDWTPTLP
ncbi:hypothetical protein [Microbacterium dauci]|uniref:Lipoprotein n=1 Tax=Microbacterium dauci TaxID=3048008 RepID=A0ABT6ZGP7_9MICO|nr:hypothetical protein [Microbacterium sp. LX3-4]MDJ1115108.1 hypothetical protein [Microbacterium sp. LX3-4]